MKSRPHDEAMAELYRSGGVRKGFDVAAVHVYSDKPGNVLETVKLDEEKVVKKGEGFVLKDFA